MGDFGHTVSSSSSAAVPLCHVLNIGALEDGDVASCLVRWDI